jgi:MATE family multidrug resistance protein
MKFLDKKFTQETLKLALPVMLTQVGQVSVNLFDNIIVGKLLGAQALASVSLGNAIFFSIFIFGMGFSLAIPPLVSEAHSQHNHDKISSVFRHGFVVNLLIGLLLIGLIFCLIPFLPHLGQPKEILPDTISFLSIVTLSIFPFMIFKR